MRSLTYGTGFYPEEISGGEPFRWMTERAELAIDAPAPGFLELDLLGEFRDGSQRLTVTGVGDAPVAFDLLPGRGRVSVPVGPGPRRVGLSVNKLFPPAYYPGDRRSLGVRVQAAEVHHEVRRHAIVTGQHDNGVRNLGEMLSGASELASTPPSLGIDMYGACNVKPPCVYCEWDWNKQLEGPFVDAPFDLDTLREWGPFFDHSTSLVNCSIAEPFMMKNIDELLDAFAGGRKILELTSNGQILTDRNIQKLVGRDIDLYVSLDAATPETYAKLRNNRFPQLVANLGKLVEAKGGPDKRPYVHAVFMPMKANVHELDQFVALAADMRVDRIVLRPLNRVDRLELNWDRAGYRFIYTEEQLPFDRLVWVSGRAAALAERAGVELSDQMDFGSDLDTMFRQNFDDGYRSVPRTPDTPAVARAPVVVAPSIDAGVSPEEPQAASVATEPAPSLGHDKQPLCTEPWKSLYILRRGVFPCCYGGEPVATMDRYREAWNGPAIQRIRRQLAGGRFPQYCLDSPSCPIVQKAEHSHGLSFFERVRRYRRAVLWAIQWVSIRTRRIATEPAYVRQHLTRLAKKAIGR